jgi:protein involved in polysaccharide export with SLBB domain
MSDALMSAGGFSPTADLGKSVVRRGENDIVPKGSLESMLSQGKSIDEYGLRSGDVLVIASRPTRNVSMIFQSVGAIIGVVVGVVALSRR